MATQQQCKKCPWLKGGDPYGIPNGYCPVKHAALTSTIAEPGKIARVGALHVMACHAAPVGAERPCVGWLHNQAGTGNNIGVRLAMVAGSLSGDYELAGKQHPRFGDTLPKRRRRGHD